jgi:hypothetical protein
MLSYLAAQVHAQHLLIVGNIGGGATQPGLWQKWTTPLDGSMEESWMDTSVSYFWPVMMLDTAWSEANGKITLLHSHYTTETGNTFGLATMMLMAAGKSSYSTANANYQTSELWFPEYTSAQSLGVPTSASTQLPGGIYGRAFANGIVLSNPSGAASTVKLLGGTYSGSQLSKVSSVPLGAASGRILLKDVPNGGPSLPPADIIAPTITGSFTVGSTVTAVPGLWSAVPTPSYTYQWTRCTTTSLNTCAVIAGVTGSTYKLTSADSGHYLATTVTAKTSAGTRAGYSALTAQVH